MITNWQELQDVLRELLINNKDNYKNKRNEMFNNIYPYLDGKARERIANFIVSPLRTKEKYVYDKL